MNIECVPRVIRLCKGRIADWLVLPLSSGRGSLELWLGGGLPLNPYLRFVVWDKITSQLRPKDLRVTPAELFVTEKVNDFQEYTTLRSWVAQWIRYCHWYYTVAVDPWVKLDSLFEGPVCTTSWKAEA